MRKNNDVEIWLSISHGLFNDLRPKNAGPEIAGHGMRPDELAALVDRESGRVACAFIEMSRANGKEDVHRILNSLPSETVIALFSRWVHFQGAWTKMLKNKKPPLRIPTHDMWRAIFLELSGTQAASKVARLI